MARRVITLLSIASGSALLLGGVGCDSTPGQMLGAFLNQTLSVVETTIHQASNAANGSVAQAGAELRLTVENAKVAYADELEKSVDKLDATTSKKVEELRGLADDLQKGLDGASERVSGRAQQIANTLPFSNLRPQVTDYTPQYATSGTSSRSVTVRVDGNFATVAEPGLGPTLLFGGKDYAPVGLTTQRLVFDVPASELPLYSPTSVVPVTMELRVPYRTGHIIKHTRTGSFKLAIGVLPPSPGTLVLVKTLHIPTQQSHHVIGPTYTLDSGSHHDYPNTYYKAEPTPGWLINPTSARFVDEWHRGKQDRSWSWRWDQISPQLVSAYVSTWWKVFYADGAIRFHFEYDEARPSFVPLNTTQSIALRWGSEQAVSVEPGQWQLTFQPFGGQPEVITGNHTEPFLEVRLVQKSVVMRAPALDAVRL